MSKVIAISQLCELIDRWIGEGKRVAAPRQVASEPSAGNGGTIQYAWLENGEQVRWDGFVRPNNSIKEFVFPRHENLYGYQLKGKQIELTPIEPPATEQIIVGARPCDAMSYPILDHVWNWDTRDEFYNRRREATTVVTVACREFDSHCFCTSVGCGPGETRGSDVLLVPLDGDRFEVRLVTKKGERLFADSLTESSEEGKIIAGPPVRFDLAEVGNFLSGGYDRPEWREFTMRCLACGACAYTCPTCHCFDIVDEGNASGGVRARNWDACQFSMFTLHASGHNPRTKQGDRQRQRVYHKFQIYPEKFGDLLCTGCGNCTRNCPVGLGILSVLEAITQQQESTNASSPPS